MLFRIAAFATLIFFGCAGDLSTTEVSLTSESALQTSQIRSVFGQLDLLGSNEIFKGIQERVYLKYTGSATEAPRLTGNAAELIERLLGFWQKIGEQAAIDIIPRPSLWKFAEYMMVPPLEIDRLFPSIARSRGFNLECYETLTAYLNARRQAGKEMAQFELVASQLNLPSLGSLEEEIGTAVAGTLLPFHEVITRKDITTVDLHVGQVLTVQNPERAWLLMQRARLWAWLQTDQIIDTPTGPAIRLYSGRISYQAVDPRTIKVPTDTKEQDLDFGHAIYVAPSITLARNYIRSATAPELVRGIATWTIPLSQLMRLDTALVFSGPQGTGGMPELEDIRTRAADAIVHLEPGSGRWFVVQVAFKDTSSALRILHGSPSDFSVQ